MRKIFLIFIALLMLLSMPSCDNKKKHDASPINTVIIVGNHSNTKVPDIGNKALVDILEKTCRNGGTVSSIIVDGSPYPCISGTVEATDKDVAIRNTVSYYIETIRNTEPITPEVDIMSGFLMANSALSIADDDSDKQIVILGSGLSTCGKLDFRKNLLACDNPKIIVDALLEEGFECSNFKNAHITWIGIGQTDGNQQKKLSPTSIKTLKYIYEEYFLKCGAKSVDFIDTPLKDSTSYEVSVSPVILPNDESINVSNLNMSINESEISFVPDTAQFIDHAAAKEKLFSLAAALKKSPKETIYIFGCCASMPSDYEYSCIKLSKERAEAVKTVLITDFNVPNEIICAGLGYDNPWQVDDLDENGRQTSLSQLNRKVVILSESNALFYGLI